MDIQANINEGSVREKKKTSVDYDVSHSTFSANLERDAVYSLVITGGIHTDQFGIHRSGTGQEIVGEELRKGVTSSVHQSIFRSIDRVKNWLKNNPFVGEQVQKSLIPKHYIQQYDITNLWRIELSNYWRLIYTIRSTEVEIINFVLNIVNHKKYDKIFGYKKK